MARHSERGFSLAELMVILAIMGILVTVAAGPSLGWLGRDSVRNVAYQAQTLIQLARVEAVTRNRSCAFLLNSTTRSLSVMDLNDPAVSTDDITIATATLPSTLRFEDPLGNPALTIRPLGSGWYGTVFAADGTVAEGSGVIALATGGGYERISLLGAGASKVERWNGSAWQAGS